MAIKNATYTYKGANQDTSKSKHPFQFYFEAGHIRIVSTDTQSTDSITNEKGNELIIQIPNINIIGVINPPVIANDESINIDIGAAVTIYILENDIYSYPVTITMITPPTKGTFVINDNNSISYTHTGSIVETDSFVYQIDDQDTTDTATVSIQTLLVDIDDDDDNDNDGDAVDSNFDGVYYHYVLAPCDRDLAFIRVKTINKVNVSDWNVYDVLGSGGLGKAGKLAYEDEDLSETPWTLGFIYGPDCPDLDDGLPPRPNR